MIEIIAGSLPYLDNPPFVFAVPICCHYGVGSQGYVEDGASVVMTPKSNTFFSANTVLVSSTAINRRLLWCYHLIAATRYMYSRSGYPLLADSDPSIHRKHTKICNIILSFLTHLHEHQLHSILPSHPISNDSDLRCRR